MKKKKIFKNIIKGCRSEYEITDLMIKRGERIIFWGEIQGFYENELMAKRRVSIENEVVKSHRVFNTSKLYIELEEELEEA